MVPVGAGSRATDWNHFTSVGNAKHLNGGLGRIAGHRNSDEIIPREQQALEESAAIVSLQSETHIGLLIYDLDNSVFQRCASLTICHSSFKSTGNSVLSFCCRGQAEQCEEQNAEAQEGRFGETLERELSGHLGGPLKCDRLFFPDW